MTEVESADCDPYTDSGKFAAEKVNLWLKQRKIISDCAILASMNHKNVLKIFRRKPE